MCVCVRAYLFSFEDGVQSFPDQFTFRRKMFSYFEIGFLFEERCSVILRLVFFEKKAVQSFLD